MRIMVSPNRGVTTREAQVIKVLFSIPLVPHQFSCVCPVRGQVAGPERSEQAGRQRCEL